MLILLIGGLSLMALVLASFFNVVIYRTAAECELVKDKKGRAVKLPAFWRGRSVCDHCQKEIQAIDNIPLISYLMLGGKCRHCGTKIPSRYFSTELLALFYASFFALFSYQQLMFGSPHPLVLAAQFVLGLILIFIVLADYWYLIIPDFLTILLVFVALPLGLANWQSGLIGVAVAAAFFIGLYWLAAAIFKKEAFGIGDIKLMLPLAFILGWQQTLVSIFLSFIIGGFFATILLLLGKKKLGQTLPFGPFLVLAFTLTYFWGNEFLAWYIGLIL